VFKECAGPEGNRMRKLRRCHVVGGERAAVASQKWNPHSSCQ